MGLTPSLLRRASEKVQRVYHARIEHMIRTRSFPVEYSTWIAMLVLKGKDKDPNDLSRRRDLWVVPHDQKLRLGLTLLGRYSTLG